MKAPVAKNKAGPAKRKQATPTKSKAAPKTSAAPKTKDTTMATKTKTTNIASDMANEMQTRLAGMYEKGTEMTGEMVTFQRANAEAKKELQAMHRDLQVWLLGLRSIRGSARSEIP